MKRNLLPLFSKYFFLLFILFTAKISLSQVELVDPSNKVYDFLDRMQTNKIITNFSSSMLPISRKEIANLLVEINNKSNKISKTDKKFLNDYLLEYEYDINHTLTKAKNFLPKFKFSEIFNDKNQKYLYSSIDSNASFS